MSANENTARAEKLARRQKALDEQAQKNKAFKRNVIIVIVVVVLLVAAALVITSDIFYTSTTAVRIGSTSYSPAETSVFFRNAYTSFYNSWASNIQSLFGTSVDVDSYIAQFTGLDRSVALDEQQYSDTQTWSDYFMEQAKLSMQQVTALCDAAQRDGYVLPDEAAAEIDSSISSLASSVVLYGYSNLDQYLSLNYGKGVTEKVFRSVLLKIETAEHYADSVEEARSFTDEQLVSYYTEHADELDVISYYSFSVSSSNDAFAEEADDDAKLAAARAAAAEIAESADLESYLAACAELGTEPTVRHTAAQNISSDLKDWLMSADRKTGDAAAIDSSSGAYAVWFVNHDDNNYQTRAMRHILINAEQSEEDGTYSEEALAAAEARIREIEQEWKGNPTEAHFAELAEQYSEDGGSNTNGGLYEDIQKHNMVTNIDEFLFDAATIPGDTAVLEGESSLYHGYHLVYYVGECDTVARCAIAEPLLREEEQNAWLEGLTASGYDIVDGSGLRYVNNT